MYQYVWSMMFKKHTYQYVCSVKFKEIQGRTELKQVSY